MVTYPKIKTRAPDKCKWNA